MTAEEERNLKAVERWEHTYNHDFQAMVDEVYAPDCEVRNMFAGSVFNGREALRAVEREIHTQVPERKLRVLKTVACGDTVALECEGVFPGQTFAACVFLTFDANGQVKSDHTYSPDPSGVTLPEGSGS